MIVMYIAWKILKRSRIVPLLEMDLETDVHTKDDDANDLQKEGTWKSRAKAGLHWVF